MSTPHVITVEARSDNHHGYPYRATCSCWWRSQRSYASIDAAQIMGGEHLKEVTA